MAEVLDLPLDLLHVGGDHIPGPMDVQRVLALVRGELVDDRPLEVSPSDCGWEVRNGRHRYVAGLLRGDKTAPCEVKR